MSAAAWSYGWAVSWGRSEEGDYATRLRAAGFEEVDIDPWRIYQIDDARAFLTESGADVDRIAPAVDGKPASAFIRARKPAAKGSIQIYDLALCCSTGVRGGGRRSPRIGRGRTGWAHQRGATIERFNLAQQPLAFALNPVVSAFLQRSGAEALPLVLVDGEVALAGRYPTRTELARWAGLTGTIKLNVPSGGCCGGSDGGCS